jgi:hypothetical protein
MAMRAIFRGFCMNRFGIGPLHYKSSRYDFGFEFVEIFVIGKRLPIQRVGESPSRRVGYWMFKKITPLIGESRSRRVVEYPYVTVKQTPRNQCARYNKLVPFKNVFFGGFFSFLFVQYSALLHLPPLRFHCADGCLDRTQDRFNLCIGSQTL